VTELSIKHVKIDDISLFIEK